MRKIHDHKVMGLGLPVAATDEPGHGGANHEYEITDGDGGILCRVVFQNGGVQTVGLNGVTHEALLAIVLDRLRSFNAGPYSCRENALAITKIEEALHWLHHHTLARMSRGVEGTHQV